MMFLSFTIVRMVPAPLQPTIQRTAHGTTHEKVGIRSCTGHPWRATHWYSDVSRAGTRNLLSRWLSPPRRQGKDDLDGALQTIFSSSLRAIEPTHRK
jgi:hypothetical protein